MSSGDSPARPAASACAGRCSTSSSTAQRGLGLTDFESHQLHEVRAGKRAQLEEEMTA